MQTYGRPKRKRAEEEEADGAEDEDALLSGPLSARILKEAAAQRQEVDADDAGLGPAATVWDSSGRVDRPVAQGSGLMESQQPLPRSRPSGCRGTNCSLLHTLCPFRSVYRLRSA